LFVGTKSKDAAGSLHSAQFSTSLAPTRIVGARYAETENCLGVNA